MDTLKAAYEALPAHQREALDAAAQRIRAYHEHQKTSSWQIVEANGTRLGQQVMPLDRVGIYVPGGKACYPSSVLMNALPAKVAGNKVGVDEGMAVSCRCWAGDAQLVCRRAPSESVRSGGAGCRPARS